MNFAHVDLEPVFLVVSSLEPSNPTTASPEYFSIAEVQVKTLKTAFMDKGL